MRLMIKATLPTEAMNEFVANGSIEEKIGAVLQDLKPESVYFGISGGRRTAWIVVNTEDGSQSLPAIAEPLFLTFNAQLEISPVMTPEDLGAAGPDLAAAAQKYG